VSSAYGHAGCPRLDIVPELRLGCAILAEDVQGPG
jgi:hypothetical protein